MTSSELANMPLVDRLRYQLSALTLAPKVDNKTLDQIRTLRERINNLEEENEYESN